jgi:hypothetical protein
LIKEIGKTPRALTVAEIGAIFVRLQERSFLLCREHFNFDLTEDQSEAWPLHLLSRKHLALKLMVQWLAGGDRRDWQAFFTKPEHRVPLVHGILGEILNQRVFNQPAFSLNGHHSRELEEFDEEYIHYDAFVRTKRRAQLLKKIMAREDYKAQHEQDFHAATAKLSHQVMAIIETLLPPPIFDLLNPRQKCLSHSQKKIADETKHEISTDIHNLIKDAASLHFCIRLTGENGTVVRMAPHIAKGSKFHKDAPYECVNSTWVNSQKSRQITPGDHIQIKMTCWSRVEAVVPHGPDVQDLEDTIASIQETRPQHSMADIEALISDILPNLPEDLQSKTGSENEQDQLSEPDWSDTNLPPSSVKRGSYVTVYNAVCPSSVYCEWVRGIRPRQTTTLNDAITQRRKQLGLKYQLEDALIDTYNSLASNWWKVEGSLIAGTAVIVLGTAAGWYFRNQVSAFADFARQCFADRERLWVDVKRYLTPHPRKQAVTLDGRWGLKGTLPLPLPLPPRRMTMSETVSETVASQVRSMRTRPAFVVPPWFTPVEGQALMGTRTGPDGLRTSFSMDEVMMGSLAEAWTKGWVATKTVVAGVDGEMTTMTMTPSATS